MATKDPVRLRQRITSTGLKSLYLDIYVDGKRKNEYLKLYLVKEKTAEDRQKNRDTMLLAESIRAKRLVEVRNHKYGFDDEPSKKVRFFDYYDKMCEERRQSDGNYGNWLSARHNLREYEQNENITFAEITPDWVRGFRDYLDTKAVAFQHDGRTRLCQRKLSQNSKVSYFNKLRACLNQAYEQRVIDINPARGIEGFKATESTRMYLTIDEVKLLAATDCDYPAVKTAFLFSCLTGLRRSDILNLRWGDVHQQGEFTRIIFRQKKTSGQEYLDISPQAVELMGERKTASEHVFAWFMTPDATNHALAVWCAKAGINKKISFHCGRHTFAVMMLDLGTDIYTTSKLLGHRDLSTTQIYAKVLDKNKQQAVANIPRLI